MNHHFLSAAEADLANLLLWYEQKSPGLGDRFLDDLEDAIRRIKRSPEAWKQFGTGHRRIMLRVFKAGVVYRINDSQIEIIALIDLRSNPVKWKTLLKRRT